ncbi:NAD(+) diphosphatase [Chenggangzhangella methanolivorans]|uniref:NAD(+) diphosphatase n=1 Tax=Chenggangzhangella methanolivorans TaxID=1437009 RepID=A0A9E6RJ22_9HYPH|nr:NAD(+) diphosphatase [Chenggangzhangella methanolivorans]QZO01912.1 NAD(+) diphosphatase [Chenggangzhangella methanolivorans]
MSDETPELGYARMRMDRMAEKRDDAAFVEAEAARDDARFLAFAGDALVMAGEDGGPLLDAAALSALGPSSRAAYLGRHHGAPRFAASLTDAPGDDDLPASDLRALAVEARLAGEALALGGYAKSMAAWHARHRFCANCGSATDAAPGGWRRVCASCGALHFPRVDPVAIMLVTRGDRCLLGRQARFPPGMWSCLAGFVEPGETVEDAARREIKEEAGLDVGPVAYELSQPWPFPSQLMLGVSCEALSDEITPDFEELEDARWFARDEAALMLARTHGDGLFAPPPSAIAHHLLRRFVQRGG